MGRFFGTHSFISFSDSLLTLVDLLWVSAFLVDPLAWGKKMTIPTALGDCTAAEDVC
jgi:hypothetical protein